jgi:hypothetical protein
MKINCLVSPRVGREFNPLSQHQFSLPILHVALAPTLWPSEGPCKPNHAAVSIACKTSRTACGLQPITPIRARAGPGHGDAAGGRSAPHREVLGTNSIRHDSRLRFAPVHRYARFMIIATRAS